MKVAALVFFTLACAAGGAAQSPASGDAPADVTVVKFNWQRLPRNTGWDAPTFPATSQSVEDLRGTPLPQESGVDRLPNPVGRSTSASSSRERRRASNSTALPPVSNDQPAIPNQTDTAPRPPARGGEEYIYRLRIKNGGVRRVESVDWEYVFFDPASGKELGRHRFVTPRRARPGETVTLDAPSLAPPSRTVPASSLDKKRGVFDERIVVRCIVYSDGTFARRDGAAEADCDGLRTFAAGARRP